MDLTRVRQQVKSSLGSPVIDTDVPDSTVDSGIQAALSALSTWHPGTRTVSLGTLNTTSNPSGIRYLIEHPGLQGVVDCEISRITHLDSLSQLSNPFTVYSLSSFNAGMGRTVGEYAVQLGYLEDARRVISAQPDWKAQQETVQVTDPNNPAQTINKTSWVLYLYLPPYTQRGFRVMYEYAFSYELSDNPYNGVESVPSSWEHWIAEYAQAKVSVAIARVLGKHKNVPGIDGKPIKFDDDRLFAAANTRIRELEDQLRKMQTQTDILLG